MTHILWDWNGTLLDDTQAALDTLNAMLARRKGRPIAMDYYRDHFAFPVKPFYKSIGVCLENEDWDALAVEYHDTYAAQPKRLNPEAVAALERVKSSGARQSIISALRQDLLDAALGEFGIRRFFDYAYGVDNLDGHSKLERARELVARERLHLGGLGADRGVERPGLRADGLGALPETIMTVEEMAEELWRLKSET